MNRTVKIILFSLALLATLTGLYFSIDSEKLGEFWSLESVKHYLTSVLVTAAIIFGFCLYRLIFNTHSQASHNVQHALLGGLHGDLISAVMTADAQLKELTKDLKGNAEKIRKFHRQYLAGLVIISILIITLIVPIFGLISSGIDNNPEEVNPLAVVFYFIAYALRVTIVMYWAFAVVVGWKKVSPGHKGVLLLNGHIIGTREYGDGSVFTLPPIGTIDLKEVEEEVAVAAELKHGSEPMIVTASAKNAVYDLKSERNRLDKDTEDALHGGRLFVSEMKTVVIFRLTDVVTFFKTKRSIEEARERLSEMIQTLRLETIGKKDYAQIVGFLEVARKRIKKTMEAELKEYDRCFEVKNALITKINFAEPAGGREKVKLLTLADAA